MDSEMEICQKEVFWGIFLRHLEGMKEEIWVKADTELLDNCNGALADPTWSSRVGITY